MTINECPASHWSHLFAHKQGHIFANIVLLIQIYNVCIWIIKYHINHSFSYKLILTKTCHADKHPNHHRPHTESINPLHAEIFGGNIKNTFAYFIIFQHWYGAGSANSSSWKTRTGLYYIVEIIAADDLATQGDSASAAMTLTSFSWCMFY